MAKLPQLHGGGELTEVQVSENFDAFMAYISEKFTGDRLAKLLTLYAPDNYGTRAAVAPASSRLHYHSAHVGGYIQHIMNVEKATIGATKLFSMMGGEIDYTDEERCMVAMSHDLGKLGLDEGEYYLPQTEEWALKKYNATFEVNPAIQRWDVTDAALFILQKNGIALTWKETLAIKLSDGMFAEKNKSYFVNNAHEGRIRTNLPYVIHWGDWISARSETSAWEQLQK